MTRSRGPARSLRSALALALVVLTASSGAVSLALVLVTRNLHAVNGSLEVETRRHESTQEAIRELLLRDRARSPAVRESLERDIVRRLEEVVSAANGGQESEAAILALATCRARFDSAQPEPPSEEDAPEALDVLSRVQANALANSRREAGRSHAMAHVIGVTNAALVFFASMLLFLLLERQVLRPLSRLAARISAFGRGDLSLRAAEDGPREVREMARAFNAMADRLSEQDLSHRTYLSGVAHDLRNPVHVLRGAVSLDPALVSEPSQVRRVLGIVQRQLGQIERLVDDVADVESLRMGTLKLDLSSRDLRALASAVVELFETASRRHRILLSTPAEPVLVVCDGPRIQQVITNVVSNAIKYSPAGGDVEVEVSKGCGTAAVRVTDKGIGMTERQVENAFGAFSRGEAVRDRIPGQGLGLFVAARIVDDHGGAIHVKSVPGGGTSLLIELPTALADELSSHEATRSRPIAASPWPGNAAVGGGRR